MTINAYELDCNGQNAIEAAKDIHSVNPGAHVVVQVRENWRVCVDGKAFGGGEFVRIPILQAAEWLGWGSVTLPPRQETKPKAKPKGAA